jgi:hypothetical protein
MTDPTEPDGPDMRQTVGPPFANDGPFTVFPPAEPLDLGSDHWPASAYTYNPACGCYLCTSSPQRRADETAATAAVPRPARRGDAMSYTAYGVTAAGERVPLAVTAETGTTGLTIPSVHVDGQPFDRIVVDVVPDAPRHEEFHGADGGIPDGMWARVDDVVVIPDFDPSPTPSGAVEVEPIRVGPGYVVDPDAPGHLAQVRADAVHRYLVDHNLRAVPGNYDGQALYGLPATTNATGYERKSHGRHG